MAIVLLSYLNILIVSHGMGLLFLFLTGIKIQETNLENFFKISMAGFGISLALAGIISIFWHVNSWVNLGFTLFSMLAITRFIALNLSKLQFKLVADKSWIAISILLPFVILIFCSVFMAGMLPQIKDTWFYHLQAIKWIEEFGVVKGLGNLFSNAAYNSGVFIGNAIFSLKPITGQNYFGVNVFLWLTTLFYAIARTVRHFQQKDFQAIMIESFVVFLVYRYFYLWLSSSGQDPASAFILIFSYFMIRDIMKSEECTFDRIVLSILFITLITIKLSNVVFIIPAGFILFSCWKSFTGRKLSLVILPLFILVPWLIRNVLLTGYLLYPYPGLDFFSFDWKIPQMQVLYEEMLIRSWALKAVLPDAPVSIFPLNDWFPAWFSSIGLLNNMLLIASIFSLFITIVLVFLRRMKINALFLVFGCTIYLSLIFWFLTAPSPRFIIGIMLISLILPFELFSVNRLLMKFKPVLLIILILMMIFSLEPQFRGEPQKYASKFSLAMPPAFPVSQAKSSIFNGVLMNYLDPAVSLESFDAELPCTPQLRRGLVMRGNEVKYGFRIDPEVAGEGQDNFQAIKKYYLSPE